MKLSHASNIVYRTPWAIEERAFDAVAAMFERHISGADIAKVEPRAKPQSEGGVGVISIMGPIIPRANFFSNVSGASSSEGIAKQAREFMNDPAIESIMLRIDSPGGSVLGGFEAADALYAAAQAKPMIALIEGVGASLAYLFASQAGEIYATRGSIVGSIGVIARIPMTDRMERNEGIDTITVASSRDKAMSGLSEGEIRERMKAEVEQYFSMMKDTIARSRSSMDMESVATGKTWKADEAMELGAIDGITTYEELFASMKIDA